MFNFKIIEFTFCSQLELTFRNSTTGAYFPQGVFKAYSKFVVCIGTFILFHGCLKIYNSTEPQFTIK